MVESSQKSYFLRVPHSIQCAFYTIFFTDLSYLILGFLRLFSLIPAS